VLFYAKFSPLHGLPVILDAVERLKAEPIHFTIVGGGQLEDEVRRAVARSRSSALEWIPWLEREALIERMRNCQLSLGIFGDTSKAAMVIPNKVFQALAMGVPVITRDSPAIRELLDAGQSLFTCATDGATLATVILTCRRNFKEVKAIAQKGRDVFNARASHAAIARQFLEAVDGR